MKKINKGLILTVIVLVVLTIYLVNLEKQRNEEKPHIRTICEKFIEITDKYSVLPKEKQVLNTIIDQDEFEQYMMLMKNQLNNIMISKEDAVLLQYKVIGENLQNGYSKFEARTNQKRTIKKVTRYEFDGDQVTVKFENKVEKTTKYITGEEEQVENKSFDALYDEIILQKVNGEWKVVYANLQFNDYDKYYDFMMF